MKRLCLVPLLAIVCLSCVPEPLEGFDDIETSSNSTTDVGMSDVPSANSMTSNFNAQFLTVHGIMTQNCLLLGCHGGTGVLAQVFVVPTAVSATPGELQAVLSNPTPTDSGNKLIEPSNPNASQVYINITKPVGDPDLMGAGQYGMTATPLTMDLITSIQSWIQAGAPYTQ